MEEIFVDNRTYILGAKLVLRRDITIKDFGVWRWGQGINKITRISVPNNSDLKWYNGITENDYLIQVNDCCVFTSLQITKYFLLTD